MLDNKNNLIVGYSGHAFVVADAFLETNRYLKYYTAKSQSILNPFNLEFLGDESDEAFVGWKMQLGFILGVGDNKIRENIGLRILRNKQRLLTVIHPHSSISKHAGLGEGVFVSRGVMVNALVEVHSFVILNTACVIDHDCRIGQAVHVAPGAVLAGNVQVGDRTFIGANSVIKQGVTIGKDVIIGAGSVVLKDIPDNSIVFGIPAK